MKKTRESLPGKGSGDDRKLMGRSRQDVAIPATDSPVAMPDGYASFFAEIKERIARERTKAVLAVNAAMTLMYWDIGSQILEKQRAEGWGAKVVDRLSHDLKTAFPGMSGFSSRNLKYMRKFTECWPDRSIVQRVVAQIPWRSNAKYTLSGYKNPIGVAQLQRDIIRSLPEEFKSSLPTIEEIEAELEGGLEGEA